VIVTGRPLMSNTIVLSAGLSLMMSCMLAGSHPSRSIPGSDT
jgi:hypothetical protein